MGNGRWTADSWTSYKTTKIDTAATTDALYASSGKARKIDPDLDPKGITLRESCDSDANPNSTPIIVALDVTGSMGMVADAIARTLGTLMQELLDRKPVVDPHLMFMGVGDVHYDNAPLQVTQFEADTRIADQLLKMWLEKGGGGNSSESYNLPWYFASYHTATDAAIKRKKKGYLFTIGDEEVPPALTAHDIEKVMGSKPEWASMSNEDLLAAVGQSYHVYHVMVEQGNHMRYSADRVRSCWTNLLGQRALSLSDHTKIAEVIISTIQVNEGADVDTVVKSWSDGTSLVVAKAVRDLKRSPTDAAVVML